MRTDTIENIKELIAPLAEAEGLFLVDIEVNTGGGTEVCVFLDAEDRGVNLDECAKISRELGFLLEAHELFDNEYRLNVSSPGLSRPLVDLRQYGKNVGRSVKMKYKADQDYKKCEGIIVSVEGDLITVNGEDGSVVKVVFGDILETKIVPKI